MSFFCSWTIFLRPQLVGGTFALYSLLCRHAKVGLLPNDRSADEVMHYEREIPFTMKVESRAKRTIEKHKSSHYVMLVLALLGSCMTIGVGVLTPALSGLALLINFFKLFTASSFCLSMIE